MAEVNRELTTFRHRYSSTPPIGSLSDVAKGSKLLKIGDRVDADQLKNALKARRKPKPYEYTNHEIGYMAAPAPGVQVIDLVSATTISPEMSLAGQAVNVSLDRIRVKDYPGDRMHRVMMDFGSTNRLPGNNEEAHYQQTFRAQEGDQVGVLSLPIFKHLGVGNDGLVFQCYTVNVENDNDKEFLNILESGPAKKGLELLSTAQPAIQPFVNIAIGITKMVASRNDNVPVQDIVMGLLLSNAPAQGKLAQGSYVAAQAPVGDIQWSDWQFDIRTGLIKKKGTGELLPFNYFIFSVTKSP